MYNGVRRAIFMSAVVLAVCASATVVRAGIFVPGFPNDPTLHPMAASTDYDVVVGYMESAQGDTAFVWRPAGSVLNLKNLLVSNGVVGVSDWNLTMATMVSPDGATICGWGVDPASQNAPWMAQNLSADVNLDWKVDIFDVNVISSNWGSPGPEGDANGDGLVDIFDINVVSAAWGQAGTFSGELTELPPQPSNDVEAAPEPASLLIWALLAAGVLSVARWRRRRS